MKYWLTRFLMAVTTITALPINAQDFTLYLVRHAEKQQAQSNPSLTECGLFRANQLAQILSFEKFQHVYSTQYKRTRETATPLATAQNLPIKYYAPNALEQFAFQLKKQQANALIVGHSNTTPMLVNLLAETNLAKLSEDEFSMLYQIQFIGEQVKLTLLKQPLVCR
mgnify:CR=1 FL=1